MAVSAAATDTTTAALYAALNGTKASETKSATESTHARFSSVALHWLLGLVLLTRGDDAGALALFQRELANEGSGQLYARECCANTWYAIGGVRLHEHDLPDARAAFAETLTRIPVHPAAQAVVMSLEGTTPASTPREGPGRQADSAPDGSSLRPEAVLARVTALARAGQVDEAIGRLESALRTLPEGSAFWTRPVDPVLRPWTDARWLPVLAVLRNRAA